MRTFKILALILATGTMALAGCSKDTTTTAPENPTPENPIPEPETKTLKVVVGNTVADSTQPAAASADTRATLKDGAGFNWEATDDQQFYAFVSGTDGATKSNGIEIGEDGNATFTFNAAIKADRQMWFMYGTPNIAGKKNECTIAASQVQSAPGMIDKTHLQLRTALTPIAEDSDVVMPSMYFIGAVQRFLIYSETGLYSDEKVLSITMTSSDNVAGLIGYNSAGQPVGMDGSAVEKETIYWNQSKAVSLTINAPKAVTATTRGETLGHGLYMSIAPVTVPAGYSYLITTDKATYTLISSSARTFTNGQLVNIFVNLENANVKRIDLSALKLRYGGSLAANQTYTGSFEGGRVVMGYYVAYVDDGESEKQHSTFPADAMFYSSDNIDFEITDLDGNPVNWLTCAYRTNDTWLDATCDPNAGAERTAKITATFHVPGYTCTNPTITVYVKQSAYTNEEVLTYQNKALGNVNWAAEAKDANTGCWFVAYINGTARDGGAYFGQPYYRNVEYTTEPVVDWVTFHLPDNSNNIWANAQTNDTGAARSVKVTVKYTGTEDGYTVSDADRIVGTFNFTQAAE